jgi:hypothetical protein
VRRELIRDRRLAPMPQSRSKFYFWNNFPSPESVLLIIRSGSVCLDNLSRMEVQFESRRKTVRAFQSNDRVVQKEV